MSLHTNDVCLPSDVSISSTDNRPTINTDTLGVSILQLKIQQTQAIFNDHFEEMNNRLQEVKELRDALGKIRAAADSDLTYGKISQNPDLEDALAVALKHGIAIPDLAKGTAKANKETIIQNFDTMISHMNTTNQQGLIKIQQLQNEIHLTQDLLSALVARYGRTGEKMASAISGR